MILTLNVRPVNSKFLIKKIADSPTQADELYEAIWGEVYNSLGAQMCLTVSEFCPPAMLPGALKGCKIPLSQVLCGGVSAYMQQFPGVNPQKASPRPTLVPTMHTHPHVGDLTRTVFTLECGHTLELSRKPARVGAP